MKMRESEAIKQEGESPVEAVIFDFDGVIADTEPLHHQTFCEVVQDDGLACSWDDYVREYIGFDDRDLFREAYKKIGRALSEEEVQERVETKARVFLELAARGVAVYDGVIDMVRELHARYPLAICSGALSSDILPLLDQFGLTDRFLVRVTAEDVPASKPDPACYRLTVQRLADALGRPIDAAGCVAIEDSPTGVIAARGAGLRVWAVTHTHRADQLHSAHRVFDTLAELAHHGLPRNA